MVKTELIFGLELACPWGTLEGACLRLEEVREGT